MAKVRATGNPLDGADWLTPQDMRPISPKQKAVIARIKDDMRPFTEPRELAKRKFWLARQAAMGEAPQRWCTVCHLNGKGNHAARSVAAYTEHPEVDLHPMMWFECVEPGTPHEPPHPDHSPTYQVSIADFWKRVAEHVEQESGKRVEAALQKRPLPKQGPQ